MPEPKLPDWKNPDDYAYTDELTDSEWAWEFLRRNSGYRSDWRDFEETAQLAPDDERARGLPDIVKRIGEWGLLTPANPSLNAKQLRGEILLWRPSLRAANVFVLDRQSAADRVDALPPNLELFVLDLNKPLGPQINQVRELFRLLQRAGAEPESSRTSDGIMPKPTATKPKSSTKANRPNWPLYLRALDAEANGIKINEMARILFPNRVDSRARQSMRDAMQAAKRLKDIRYMDLIALE